MTIGESRPGEYKKVLGPVRGADSAPVTEV